MIGVDKVIADVQSKFNSNLWVNVSDKKFYGRAFRNMNEDRLIPEVYVSGNNYYEVKFDDTKNAICFFDPGEQINNLQRENEVERDVNIIFAVKTTAIYPNISYRVTEEIYRDVVGLINKYFYNKVRMNNIIAGLNAYGDFNTDNLKSYDMHPWHTFSINTTMTINFKNC